MHGQEVLVAGGVAGGGATERAIQFPFRGPTTLRNGTIVRTQNHDFLVHMVALVGIRSLPLADARCAIRLILAGRATKPRSS